MFNIDVNHNIHMNLLGIDALISRLENKVNKTKQLENKIKELKEIRKKWKEL